MVDVLIPVYNGENSVLDAIDSCLLQKEVSKVIVVDDCSTDGTLSIIKNRYNLNRKVIIVESMQNGGIVSALNLGLKHVDSRFVARLDADDSMLDQRIERQLQFLIEGGYDLVGSNMVSKEEPARVIDCFGKYSGRIGKLDLMFGSIFHPTWLARRECFDAGYSLASPVEDLYFQLELLKKNFKLGVMNIVTTSYKSIGSNKITKKEKRWHWMLSMIVRLSYIFDTTVWLKTNFYHLKKVLKKYNYIYFLSIPFMALHIHVSKAYYLYLISKR